MIQNDQFYTVTVGALQRVGVKILRIFLEGKILIVHKKQIECKRRYILKNRHHFVWGLL